MIIIDYETLWFHYDHDYIERYEIWFHYDHEMLWFRYDNDYIS